MINLEISNIIDEFISFLEIEKGLKDNTLAGYGSDIRKFTESFDGDIYTAKSEDIKEFLNELSKQGKAASGIARMTASLRAFYGFLYETGRVKEDISSLFKYNKTTRKLPEILTSTEINNLFSEIGGNDFKGMRDHALLELMYATGLRATEIITLKRSDVNLRKNTVTLISGGNKRTIPLYPAATDALRAYMMNFTQLLRTSRYLFINVRGEQMTRQGLWKIISGYAKKAGIKKKISPTMLRNSFAAHLLQNGADLKSVQEMMGHLNISTTLVYSKLEKTRISRVYKNAHPRAKN